MPDHPYSVEQLWSDHDPGVVMHTIAPFLAWFDPGFNIAQPIVFSIGEPSAETISIRWSLAALVERDPRLLLDIQSMVGKQSPLRSKVQELSGYCLALIAAACFLPGQRVVYSYVGDIGGPERPPDLIIDDTPDQIRGIEAAARSGTYPAILRKVLKEKADGFTSPNWPDIIELHMSLWLKDGRLSFWKQVRP